MRKTISAGILLLAVVFGGVVFPASFALAQNPAVTVDTTDYNDYEGRLQDCKIGLSNSNFGACLVEGIYYLVLVPSAWFARTAGELFDYFVQYSLDTNSYRGQDNFIERGWSIVRDIGNVLFIFALLYIAISHILNISTSNTKKLLIHVIIAALLINFSLFFSRIIIDGGNILARQFYNNIEIPNDDNLEYKTISQGIVMHVNPQRILGSELFQPRHSVGTPENPIAPGKVDNGYAATILGMACAVNITLGITFLSVALLFVGRVIGLWFLMIFSPFALASKAMPNSGMFGSFGFNEWLKQTLSLSFMAPVFLFFLFLLIMFLQVIFQTNISDADKSTTQLLMAVMIPFAMVIFILNQAKGVATKMAGEAGSAVKNIFGSAAGYALGAAGLVGGAALGATAFVGRNVGGRIASETLERGKFQERVRLNNIRATSYDKKAREAATEQERQENQQKAEQARRAASRNAIMVKQLDNARKGTFDVRKTSLLQQASKATNFGLSNVGNVMTGTKLGLDLGKAVDTNRKKYEEEQGKKKLETAKLYDQHGREDLSVLNYAANRGIDGREEFLDRIDKMLEKTKGKVNDLEEDEKAGALGEKDKEELSRLRGEVTQMENWQKIAQEAKDDSDMNELTRHYKQEIDNSEVVRLKKEMEEVVAKKTEIEAKKDKGENLLSWEEDRLNKEYPELIKKLQEDMAAEIAKNGEKITVLESQGIGDILKGQVKGRKIGYSEVVRNDTVLGVNVGDRERAAIADAIRKTTMKDSNKDAKDAAKKLVESMGMKIGESEDPAKKTTAPENKKAEDIK